MPKTLPAHIQAAIDAANALPSAGPEAHTDCAYCMSSNTTPSLELVPSGTRHKRICGDCGRTTNGWPTSHYLGGR